MPSRFLPDAYNSRAHAAGSKLEFKVCLVGGGVPWFNALFFHHEEDTGVRKGARWPVSKGRPLGAGPGESSSPPDLASPSWGLAPKAESVRL